jgi:glucokinase
VSLRRGDAPAVLADIGGTNARFVMLRGGALGAVVELKTGDFRGPLEAIEAFLTEAAPETRPTRAALAVAGPVSGDRARLTNGTWEFQAEELRAAMGLERLRLVNDFAAVALALPHLTDADVAALGSGKAVQAAPCVALGPGTGLGVAALMARRAPASVIASEGGHATLAARDEREIAVLTRLRAKIGHVAAEDVLSGDGLVRIYDEVAALDGTPAPTRRQEQITEAALAGTCRVSEAALDLFCGWLGSYAGDLALIFGARGGVYIAGGIVPSILEFLKKSRFRACFEDKDIVADYLRAIPTSIVIRPHPAFLGLADLLAAG